VAQGLKVLLHRSAAPPVNVSLAPFWHNRPDLQLRFFVGPNGISVPSDTRFNDLFAPSARFQCPKD
jgi:hypothetical protein